MNGVPAVRISVRNLVEFILRSGDIDDRVRGVSDLEAALAGSRAHRNIQSREKSRLSGYESEVRLFYDAVFPDLVIRIEGRADGIYDGGDGVKVVDEIKGMYLDVNELEEPFSVHLAQAKCYAAMLLAGAESEEDSAESEGGSEQAEESSAHPENESGAGDQVDPRPSGAGVRMTYVSLSDDEIRHFEYRYTKEELSAFLSDLTERYAVWARWESGHRKSRDLSAAELAFPFPYREGQKKLAAAVYSSIKKGENLFLMAPTGVGKTMSCVFPAVRAVAEGHGDRIFYLTARNETLRAGREAFRILEDRGLDFRTVTITSKEKICPMREPSCNPEDCRFARGHFDRVNDAVYALINSKGPIDREKILSFAEEHVVCPFELTLDAASFCDAVLGDYNYAFDPNVRLKRFFGKGTSGDGIFLIDEAHNMIDRCREMYSASIVKEDVLAAKRAAGKSDKRLTKAFDSLNRQLLQAKHELEAAPDLKALGRPVRKLDPAESAPILRAALGLLERLQAFFENEGRGTVKEKLLDFFFALRDLASCAEDLGPEYSVYSGFDDDEHFVLRLLCVDPSAQIRECLKSGRMAVMFSATLLPIDYYRRLITGEESSAIYAPSPFKADRRIILIAGDVSARYSARGREMFGRIAYYISAMARSRPGNYMAFFPSYKMMRDVLSAYRKNYDCDEVDWVCQHPSMGEEDREIFLENFYEDPERSLVGFCVMGGVFSEGMDLAGRRLIGAAVVGAGIPQVSAEREVIRDYFGGEGFDYAYLFPGMNRVEQAAGRVIRTQDDEGVILLLDDRLLTSNYSRLFPREWADATRCTMESVEKQLRRFWEQRS